MCIRDSSIAVQYFLFVSRKKTCCCRLMIIPMRFPACTYISRTRDTCAFIMRFSCCNKCHWDKNGERIWWCSSCHETRPASHDWWPICAVYSSRSASTADSTAPVAHHWFSALNNVASGVWNVANYRIWSNSRHAIQRWILRNCAALSVGLPHVNTRYAGRVHSLKRAI